MFNSGKKKLVVLVSGGGTNMQAIIDKIKAGEINAKVAAVISSNENAYALVRARTENIPTHICALKDYQSGLERDREIYNLLKRYDADYIILAGYLGIISPFISQEYKYKIVNIHPALLPDYGGKSFYGIKVHQAVIAAKEPFSGATAHFVDENIDTGLIIAQEKLQILPYDTAETLQKRILENIEHKLLTNVVKGLCDGSIYVENDKVIFNG